jgi:hypothetical protein
MAGAVGRGSFLFIEVLSAYCRLPPADWIGDRRFLIVLVAIRSGKREDQFRLSRSQYSHNQKC